MKSLLKSLFVFALICLYSNIRAQNTQPHDPADFGLCGYDAEFAMHINSEMDSALTSNARIASNTLSGTTILTPQPSFPTNLIEQCQINGKFRIYYEDYLNTPLGGFADPTLGAVRRATLCHVLTYIETVFNINVDPLQGQYIDIYVAKSYAVANNNLAPSNTTYLAVASPLFNPASGYGTIAGYYDPCFYAHANSPTGIDPWINQYDGVIQVNFDKYYVSNIGYPIDWYNDDNNIQSQGSCRFDLFTVLLHEMSHAMGFASNVIETSLQTSIDPALNNSFTRFDKLFMYYGDPTNPTTFTNYKLVTGVTPSINPLVNSTYTTPLRNDKVWVYNSGVPDNIPIYAGTIASPYTLMPNSFCSHLNAQSFSLTEQCQYSPGFQPRFVMAPSVTKSDFRRQWTLQELRLLRTMGYQLTTSYGNSTSLNGIDPNSYLIDINSPPARTNNSQAMVSTFYYLNNNYFMDAIIPSDFTIPLNNNTPTNTTATVFPFTLAQIGVSDQQATDIITVMPNSLFGIRGVSLGGNNHGRIFTNGTSFTYTPEPGFTGRAQFGFYLWDGHEQGALRIVTIDVTNESYSLAPGDEMILSGNYEDGTEVRQWGLNPNFSYSTNELRIFEGNFGGHLSGAHPFNYLDNFWDFSGGDIVENASQDCSTAPNQQIFPAFGAFPSDHNSQGYGVWHYPNAVTTASANERYHPLTLDKNFSVLIDPVTPCKFYTFSCDLNFEKLNNVAIGNNYTFLLEFVSNPSPNPTAVTYYFQVPVNVTVTTIAPNTWQHVTFTFQYCGSGSTRYCNMSVLGLGNPVSVNNSVTYAPNGNATSSYNPPQFNPVGHFAFVDNQSLVEVNPQPQESVVASATPLSLCAGASSVNLTATPGYVACSATYNWMPGNLNGQFVTVTPTQTTTYTVTMTVGPNCSSSSATTYTSTVTVVVNPLPVVSATASPSAVFAGNPSTLTASGANSYIWQLGNLSGTSVIVNPTTTTTYTVTGTDANGCTSTATVTVLVIPACPGGPSTILPAQISNSITYNNGAFSINSPLTINGTNTNVTFNSSTVYVNSNITIASGCTLRVRTATHFIMAGLNGQGVKIDVQPGGTLIIELNSKVYSCNGYLWDGIYVNSTSAIVEVLTDARIEDAMHAIVSINGGNFFCDHATFNKNYKSIEIQPFAGNHPGIIQSCLFESIGTNTSGPITPLATIKLPIAGHQPLVGVEITDVLNITIGPVNPIDNNTFKQLECGIHVIQNSSVTITNNVFKEIVYTNYCPPLVACPNSGIGILVENNSNLISGGSLTLLNKFKNCSNGIVTRNNVNADVQYNDFDNINALLVLTSVCIMFDNNSSKTLTASNNTMTDIRYGVEVRKYDKCFVFINSNNIRRFPKGIGVYCLQNTNSPVQIYSNLFNNNNNIDRGLTAIMVQNAVVTSAGFVDIQTNDINGCSTGIRVSNITRPQISNLNNVRMYYAAPPATPEYGYRIDRCAGMTMDNNQAFKAPAGVLPITYSGLVTGFAIDQGCVLSGVANNTAQRMASGFRFSGANNLPLFYTCNFMVGNRIGVEFNGPVNIGDQGAAGNPGIAQDNHWTIPNGLYGAANNSIPYINPNFYTRAFPPPATTFFPNPNTQMLPPLSINSGPAFLVPNAPYSCTYGCPNPPCLQNQMAKFARHQAPFNQAIPADRYISTEAIYAALREDTTLVNLGTQDDSTVLAFRDSVALTPIGQARAMSESYTNNDTATAGVVLQAYTPSNLMEQNRKIVNEIYQRTWAKNLWAYSSQDTATLYSVAYQNADVGGTAVLDARVMLRYDQDDYYNPSSARMASQDEEGTNYASDDLGILYPNPATDKATYEVTLGENETGVFELYDVFGRKLQTVQLFAGENQATIDLGGLAPGMYLYRVFVNGEAKTSSTLVITR